MEARQIYIRDGKKEYYLSVDDILFAITSEGSGNYCDIYLIQHTLYKTIRIQLGQLWKLIEDLKPTNCHTLARVGRSHIINLKYLQLADPKKGTITLHTDKDVVLNKVPLAAVKSLLMLLSTEKRWKVLSVYSQRMKLMVPVENLNEEHLVIDGREYIDLGLPSGRLWATQNLYAKNVEDCGHQTFFGWEDATTIVEDESWRLPTAVEFHELFTESLKTWCTTPKGEKGVLLTGPNGNRVFLIASGYKRKDVITRDHGILSGYWTATAISESQAIAMEMSEYEETNNNSDGVNLIEGYEDILDGYQVRLVHSPISQQN